jgi:putative phosphoesterase
MKIALISDIHANLYSFERVLEDIEREQVDKLIFLGDAATFGPRPKEVVAQLRALECPCIMGNHDQYIIAPRTVPKLSWVSQWYAEQLDDDDLQFLFSFEPMLEVPLTEKRTLLCFHGSPRSNTENIFSITPESDLDEMIAGYEFPVMVGGHTHVQLIRQHKGMLIVNAGSVGQPFADLPLPANLPPRLLPWAEYAILEVQGNDLRVDLRRVTVDTNMIKQEILGSEMPNPDYWAGLWLSPDFI